MRLTDLDEGINDPHIFKAVFMAGSPGSGKSTIAKKLFSHTGLKTLNVDTFWDLYNKTKKPNGNYDKYWSLYQKQEKSFLDGRLGLVLDGSSRHPDVMARVKQKLEDMGYDCAMVFVNTSLETSLARVQARAEQTGRHVDPDYVEMSWNEVQTGLGKLQGMFGRNFLIVDNDTNANLSYAGKSLDRWLERPPTSTVAREWLQSRQRAQSGVPDAAMGQ